jgi:isovaleryl-CoA dehydrogenase
MATASAMPAEGALREVINTVIAPAAVSVDTSGAFPEQGLHALAQAGLLGLLSATDVGGAGQGLREAAEAVEAVSTACGSTAMVLLMHYSAVPVIEAFGPREQREAIASGRHLTTLAFSESGSRSHFWAPLGTATQTDGQVRLDARKSWVTAAAHADSYVWSSRPLAGDGLMTLWLVPARSTGLRQAAGFDGLGLRGNESVPVNADDVHISASAMLGADGGGLDIALKHVLPNFLVLNAAASLGLMEAVCTETVAHLSGTQLAHLDRSLAQQSTVRLDFARMRLETDRTRALLADTLTALESQRADAMLRVLEVKAAAAEAALEVTDVAMKVCGGAAFRKELGIERRFRDARAARVMAPTTDALLDFVGRAALGLPLLGEAVVR